MNNNNPENKIYLTYKTRMLAEAKIRQSGRWLNNLVSWYSFCLIIISLSHILDVYKVYFHMERGISKKRINLEVAIWKCRVCLKALSKQN
jgi:hypothetical protein